MSKILLAILGSVVNAVLPVLVGWLQKLLPISAPQGEFHSAEEIHSYLAQVRTWITDLLAEFGTILTNKNLVPQWMVPSLPAIELLIANALDAALSAAEQTKLDPSVKKVPHVEAVPDAPVEPAK